MVFSQEYIIKISPFYITYLYFTQRQLMYVRNMHWNVLKRIETLLIVHRVLSVLDVLIWSFLFQANTKQLDLSLEIARD